VDFQLVSNYAPRGDQPQAIEALVKSLRAGNKFQTLLGVTGSGKTFTMANVIQQLQRPTLVISHNKTLAAQLYAEFKSFFPHNAVEYFVSYYDYYQPEAYIPRTDTYIEKDSSINEEIERLRLSATSALMSRKDVVVVASVSCIYGLGDPESYHEMMVMVQRGGEMNREIMLSKLIDIQYDRNDVAFTRGTFRVRGDTVEICPSYTEDAIRIELWGNTVEKITRFDPLTGEKIEELEYVCIYPATHFVTPAHKLVPAIVAIREELKERVAWFESQNKLLEAQRIKMRTEYDMEMLQEMGFCSGIENYSRHLSGRKPGERPFTLIDFFPKDWMMIIDESHVTVPQIGGMFEGDRSRKTTLVEHGFRLPSALDNRPLNFAEFESLIPQVVFTSATPAAYELEKSRCLSAQVPKSPSSQVSKWPSAQVPESANIDTQTPGHLDTSLVFEQIIRPTGLTDPKMTIKPLKGQIDDLLEQVRQRAAKKERVLVTTLTKRTAEDLTDYLREIDVRVRYLHSDIDAIERVDILRSLRKGDFDVLVGINLLREGLDLPEVSLVAVLDADKEGFLRSHTALIQTAGRAARHINGEVILYADVMTDSIKKTLQVTEYRRQKQLDYNRQYNITPRSVSRAIEESLAINYKARELEASIIRESGADYDVVEVLRELEEEMQEAAAKLEFEKAALLRDQIMELKKGAGSDREVSAMNSKPMRATYSHPRRTRKASSGSKQ
jgi:excinuclease ABC subunit B